MIIFVIKSAICLFVLYGFYYFFLRNTKSLDFNRFYLMFSLFFALIVPLININFTLYLPVNINFSSLFTSPDALYQGSGSGGAPHGFLSVNSALIILYILVSSFLLARFAANIYKISRRIHKSEKVDNQKTKIVLLSDKVLPYSFLKYIFVNQTDYENGRIEDKLIIHEQVHCLQYHSIDILIIEFLKVILWFNPFIWLFGKSIELNHEYLADNEVISGYSLDEYQNTLVNLVFRNNSIYLASNFNYSSIKKRLVMMEKKKSETKILRILVTIPLFLFLGLVFANAQESSKAKNVQAKQNDTVQSPPQSVKDMKVMKGDDGKFYVIDANGNKTEATDAVPPPPPPPVEKRKVIKGNDGKLYVVEPDGKMIEASEAIPPPPPPPPPPAEGKKVIKNGDKVETTTVDGKEVESNEAVPPPPPPPPPPPSRKKE
jgi:bla regulator protein blaR1